ncbi:conjugal transfer protein TraF [Helicobacter baculiformis]|uniref:Conjugal transfer protein TraF n=1 Tax=Helicobacter baculiformis TaxID=427351 RepID=A0ABV7ZIP5_9HELI|nr:conjugal transfer protein TraF [Helicobacter baculiformis]
MGQSARLAGLCTLICGSVGALQFGQMGGISPAMGGAGVALEDSEWGLYYNPALLDMDTSKRFRLGVNVGARASGNNLPSLVGATAQGSHLSFNPNNGLYMNTQDGLAFQLRLDHKSKKTGQQKGLGALGVGVFINAFGQAHARNSNADSMTLRALGLGSLNVGYSKAFSLHKFGTLGVGVSAGYMYSVDLEAQDQRFTQIKELLSDKALRQRQSHFILDMGIVYRIVGFSVGVVLKNVNEPVVRFNSGTRATLGPQARLGMAYHYKWLNLAMDVDLTSNKTLIPNSYNRMVGGGIGLNLPFGLGVRFGAMGNIAKEQVLQKGVILTGGLCYKILRIVGLELSVQSGLKHMAASTSFPSDVPNTFRNKVPFVAFKFPNYFALRFGINVTF